MSYWKQWEGQREAISLAVNAVAPTGYLVGLGMCLPHVAAGIPLRTLFEKESTFRGSKA
jgi:hypothetical protein